MYKDSLDKEIKNTLHMELQWRGNKMNGILIRVRVCLNVEDNPNAMSQSKDCGQTIFRFDHKSVVPFTCKQDHDSKMTSIVSIIEPMEKTYI